MVVIFERWRSDGCFRRQNGNICKALLATLKVTDVLKKEQINNDSEERQQEDQRRSDDDDEEEQRKVLMPAIRSEQVKVSVCERWFGSICDPFLADPAHERKFAAFWMAKVRSFVEGSGSQLMQNSKSGKPRQQ